MWTIWKSWKRWDFQLFIGLQSGLFKVHQVNEESREDFQNHVDFTYLIILIWWQSCLNIWVTIWWQSFIDVTIWWLVVTRFWWQSFIYWCNNLGTIFAKYDKSVTWTLWGLQPRTPATKSSLPCLQIMTEPRKLWRNQVSEESFITNYASCPSCTTLLFLKMRLGLNYPF